MGVSPGMVRIPYFGIRWSDERALLGSPALGTPLPTTQHRGAGYKPGEETEHAQIHRLLTGGSEELGVLFFISSWCSFVSSHP